MRTRHGEQHRMGRVGWLRAAVLGANDGILSTASLIMGVAAAHSAKGPIMVAGIAGLAAGALSMAAGEYVSVSSQSDTERADLARERKELTSDSEGEHKELAAIYVQRGLEPALAARVAEQLMQHDALGAHARDELGIHAATAARPVQAALASAAMFSLGGILPLLILVFVPLTAVIPAIFTAALVSLAGLGMLAARAGGSPMLKAAIRVTFWGTLAMGITAAVGKIFGTIV